MTTLAELKASVILAAEGDSNDEHIDALNDYVSALEELALGAATGQAVAEPERLSILEALAAATGQTPERVRAALLRCNHCNNGNVSFDYEATVSARVENGVLRHVVLGGWLGAPSTQLFCGECGHESATPSGAQADALYELLCPVVDGDGQILYTKEG